MRIIETGFQGLHIIEPKVIGDDRGFFMEAYNENEFKKARLEFSFVQDNQSHSLKNVIRGLHFQKPPYSQTKLVRVLYGRVLDVVVDLRRGEPTFGKVFSIELSSQDKKQLLIPKGFAHGFSVLSDEGGLFYKCDTFYNAEADTGISIYDPMLKIDWRVDQSIAKVSPKDQAQPNFIDLPIYF